MPKMLVQGLGGTLYAYFMVVKPPSLFSSQKMGIVRELVHSILWKVYFSEPDYHLYYLSSYLYLYLYLFILSLSYTMYSIIHDENSASRVPYNTELR